MALQRGDAVDAFICLHQPADFGAVGQYYQNFEPVTDTQVRTYLTGAHKCFA